MRAFLLCAAGVFLGTGAVCARAAAQESGTTSSQSKEAAWTEVDPDYDTGVHESATDDSALDDSEFRTSSSGLQASTSDSTTAGEGMGHASLLEEDLIDARTASAGGSGSTAAPRVISVRGLVYASDTLRLCEEFLGKLNDGLYDEAFELVRPYFPISEDRVDKLEKTTRKQLGLAELQFGKSVEVSLVDAKAIQDSLLRYRFMHRFERDLLYWEFVFYKSDDLWMLNAIGFDDDIKVLFE